MAWSGGSRPPMRTKNSIFSYISMGVNEPLVNAMLLDAPLMIHYNNDYGWSYEDYVRHPRTAGSHAKVLRMAVIL